MQATKLFVGNLNYDLTNEELMDLFASYGDVKEAKVIRGKGFGFIEMSTQVGAETARKALDGYELKGLKLQVQLARPPKQRSKRDAYRRY
jgi:RNA recognition motif-containing protein